MSDDAKHLSRRRFLHLAAGTAAMAAFPLPAFARRLGGAPAIQRITVLRVPGEFYRSIAMNAYDRRPKGKTGNIRLVRLHLADETEGLGVEGYVRVNDETIAGLKRVIGADPLSFYTWDGDRIAGVAPEWRAMIEDPRYAWLETPLLDVIGKLKQKPVHALFGPQVRAAADCYDGTLYFADVAQNRDATVIGEIAARIKTDGYRAIKMKLGRPFRWMPGEAGVVRDIDAFIAAREAVGSNFNLMADANNGYREHFDWGVRLLRETAPYDMYWMEELFPEDVEKYRELRRIMNEGNFFIPVAEGESVNHVDRFQPYLEAGVYNFIQPDMRTAGFTNVLRAADMAARHRVELVPHNWQSEMGKIMSIHAALIKPNIPFVEDDRWKNFAIDTAGYLFRDGEWYAPDAPGWGVGLSPHYARFAKTEQELVIS